MQKRVLGRGLSALIPEKDKDVVPIIIDAISSVAVSEKDRIVSLDIIKIKPNKYQPREEFGEEKLRELVASIKEKGIVQPVLVRPAGNGGYELIAGERRLRAAQSLGIKQIPAIVKNASDADALELALIENIQREELNPMEEARAYQRLLSEFEFTQEEVAQAVGKDRSTVANMIRLLILPKEVQTYLSKNMLTIGHAKALLSLGTEKEQVSASKISVEKALSVRELENLINRLKNKTGRRPKHADPDIIHLQEELQRVFGTKVRIIHNKKKGRICIEYYSISDLERILKIIKK